MDMVNYTLKEEAGFRSKAFLAIATVFLAMALAAGLVGCTSSDDNGEDSGSASSESNSEADGSDTDADATSEDDASELVEFEEIAVVDNDYVSIVLTGLDQDGLFGYTFDVTIVNKSDSVTYMVATDDDCSVDGVQIDPLFAEEVAAGKTAYSEITIYEDDTLAEAGVAFTDIVLSFHAYDSDDWSADYVVDGESVHVYPYGEDAATTFVREAGADDEVLVDNDYVTVTVIGYDPDYDLGYAVELYITNKTDAEVMVSVDDASVNGVMCDPYWAASIGAGLNSFETIYWYSSSLEEIGITDAGSEITEIEFVLSAYNYETFDDYFDDLDIVLSPQD